ncbi:MAG: SDR family oxidoreductase [Verrucomicrobia bacterium]|nr:SDR family oxidoreductase [Verrucomicrobiota bacterium]
MNETVLITGASSGIGLELAKCFAADGSRLILTARNTAALEALAVELRQKFSAEVRVVTADLRLPETPARIFAALQVNNAGFGAHGDFAALPLDRQLDMVQVNVTALMNLTGLFLPDMIARRRGGVMNVASTAAFQAGPRMAVYYATKAFVLSFSEAIAEELAGSGVTVTAVCPGPTRTNFGQVANFRGSDSVLRAAMTAAAVARHGHKAFRKGRFVVISGVQNFLPTLIVRLLPRIVIRKIVKWLITIRRPARE